MKVTDIRTEANPFAEGDNSVGGATRIEAPEFTHLCPGHTVPDMASLRIEYVARQEILIGDSVSEYLVGFRNVEMTPEEAIRTVTSELAEACQPMTLQITSNYSPRNGIALNPQGRFIHPEAQQQQSAAPRIFAPGMN